MESQYLKEFVMLAQTKSFAKVAEVMFVSSSTVSRHIQALENELDCPLLKRNTRTAELTECGKKFLEYAKNAVLMEQQCQRELEEYKKNSRKRLSVGASSRYIADLLCRYYTLNQHLKIEYFDYDDMFLIDMLQMGDCELVFVDSSLLPENSDIITIPFECYEYHVSMPKTNPLANKEYISIWDLEKENLVQEKHNHSVHIEKMFADTGFKPKSMIMVNRGAMSFVSAGAGVSITAETKKYDIARAHNIISVPLRPKTTFEVSLCYMKSTRLSKETQRFIDYAIHNWPENNNSTD